MERRGVAPRPRRSFAGVTVAPAKPSRGGAVPGVESNAAEVQQPERSGARRQSHAGMPRSKMLDAAGVVAVLVSQCKLECYVTLLASCQSV